MMNRVEMTYDLSCFAAKNFKVLTVPLWLVRMTCSHFVYTSVPLRRHHYLRPVVLVQRNLLRMPNLIILTSLDVRSLSSWCYGEHRAWLFWKRCASNLSRTSYSLSIQYY